MRMSRHNSRGCVMRQTRVGQVDMGSGELLEGGQLAVIFPKRKNGFQVGGWVAMSQVALEAVVRANMGDQVNRTFLMIISVLDFENFVSISQSELALKLGMKPSNVSIAFKRLVDEGVLIPGPRVGRVGTYRLNPSYGWKGSAKGHNEALQARMKARGLSVVPSSGQAEPPQVVDTLTGELFPELGGRDA